MLIESGLKNTPTTQEEMADCQIKLSPEQLFKIKIGKIVSGSAIIIMIGHDYNYHYIHELLM